MSLALYQVRQYIVRPALEYIGLHSPAAEQLVMATGMTESGFQFIDQVTREDTPGPAFGLWQMERATHDDIWTNYLRYQADLAKRVRERLILPMDNCVQMQGNHYYAAIMCRLKYLRAKDDLPRLGDVDGMAAYWKKNYNTAQGAGTVEGFKQKSAPVFSLN